VSSRGGTKLDDNRVAISRDITLVGIRRLSIDEKAEHSGGPVRTAIPVPVARAIEKLNAILRKYRAGTFEEAPEVRVSPHFAAALRVNVNDAVAMGVDSTLGIRELWPRNAADDHYIPSMPVITSTGRFIGARHQDEGDKHTQPDHGEANPKEPFATVAFARAARVSRHS
jgi:hypothetical protein